MDSCQMLVLFTCLFTLLSAVQGQSFCCNAKIMDSTGEPLLEARSDPIDEGWYDQVRIRVCTTDQTYVQLWEPSNVDNTVPGVNSTWRLIWQMEAPKPLESQEMIPVNISQIFIKRSYRVGVWSPINQNTEGKIAIPYTFNARFPKLYKAQRSYDNVREGPTGVPGPPGPPGPPGSFSQLDPNDPNYFGFSCDDPGTLYNTMNEVKDQSDEIAKQIQDLKNKLDQLKPNGGGGGGGGTPGGINLRTGACPSGWSHGPYGNGYCYKVFPEAVSFAEASMRCLTDSDHVNGGGALLTSIDNSSEDDFVTSLVLQELDPNEEEEHGEWTLWTAGMYNVQEKIWLWYYQRAWQYKLGGLESPQVGYTNWAPGEPPSTPDAKREICLLLRVRTRLGVKESVWISSDCRAPNFFICKAPKQCY